MASGHNMDEAQETYTGFTGLIKWGTISSILAVVLVLVLIT